MEGERACEIVRGLPQQVAQESKTSPLENLGKSECLKALGLGKEPNRVMGNPGDVSCFDLKNSAKASKVKGVNHLVHAQCMPLCFLCIQDALAEYHMECLEFLLFGNS